MLNENTKRRIDTARDILVGKIPDPKSQVEQITFALIYKFMDDMDRQSVSMGGKASFFANGYEQYAWSNLMDKRMGGAQRMDLYVRALEAMYQNPFIPQLFRDIFKGAFLPYRDAVTLNLFLKEINEFSYDHSEDLGDAYEYLLSIFGTQGNAGQFRTPRHIIDFIVAAVNPTKMDSILDPACGTAGFLISAYKHILKQNEAEPLTGDERARLTENFTGYDISPDMVRLSRVNMYLHAFANPTIHEYDTLTNEDRWDDTFDVILANPPFMTPKGGIRPHNRFAVRANRSEVLFVDYIAEHLNPGGRAGIIVPEGIIFQSSNAYKALRKMLVEENYLYAVVSLPAGVFQPYSGVKTSILLLDRALAKRTDQVLLVKVENDGFDLGAQRRPIDRNDLPEICRVIRMFKSNPDEELIVQDVAKTVGKSDISKDHMFNLSLETYNKRIIQNAKWPLVKLGDDDLFAIVSGGTPDTKCSEYWEGNINWITLIDLPQENLVTKINSTQRKITNLGLEKSSAKLLPIDTVIVSSRATIGRVAVNEIELATNQGFKNIVVKDRSKINPMFLALMMTYMGKEMSMLGTGGTYKEISKANFSTLEILLPPLEVQQEIVDEIESYQKIIDGARQVVENYKPIIKIDPDWPLVPLGEVCDVVSGQSPKSQYYNQNGTGTPFYQGKKEFSDKFIGSPVKWTTSETKIAHENDVLMSVRAPVGPVNIATQRTCIGRGLAAIRPYDERINHLYLFYYLRMNEDQIIGNTGSTFASINNKDIGQLRIPLPPIKLQNEIVIDLELEYELIKNLRSFIKKYRNKINDVISEIWEGR